MRVQLSDITVSTQAAYENTGSSVASQFSQTVHAGMEVAPQQGARCPCTQPHWLFSADLSALQEPPAAHLLLCLVILPAPRCVWCTSCCCFTRFAQVPAGM